MAVQGQLLFPADCSKMVTVCSRRSTTDGFAEQNGRDAEQSGLIL